MTVEISLLILIVVAGFYMAWNIGANDVSNAMGTSVGSGALSLRQAIYVAAILEFCGAFFFGSHVSETMQSGIINPGYFAANPTLLLLGMLSALIGTGIWLQVASYFGWPVSTTHTIVGAIFGFGVLMGGTEAIHWDEVFFIFSSWILSPLLGALFGYAIFSLIRKKIFYADCPLTAAKKWMPFFVFAVFALMTLLLLFNGLQNLNLDFDFVEAGILSVVIGSIATGGTKLYLNKWMSFPKTTAVTEPLSPQILAQIAAAEKQLEFALAQPESEQAQMESLIEELNSTIKALKHSVEFDHAKADFEAIEKMFGWLQILSACLMAFAHGANDVANAIGPLSAALSILATGTVAFDPVIPAWTLALGGFGIVIGLATWGWRVIETIGKKITELTPTRGFSAEFAAAATILLASRFGMPISTTHTLVGAVIGVGLARGIEALNIGTMRDIVASWIVTIPAGACTAIAVFTLLAWIFGS